MYTYIRIYIHIYHIHMCILVRFSKGQLSSTFAISNQRTRDGALSSRTTHLRFTQEYVYAHCYISIYKPTFSKVNLVYLTWYKSAQERNKQYALVREGVRA